MVIVLTAAVMVGVGGIVYWSSKLTGRAVIEPAARLAVLPLLGGALLFGGGDFIGGFFDQPSGLVTGSVRSGAEAMNVVGLVGAALFALGILVALAALARTFVPSGSSAPADPWNGHTLEWASGSPPPVGNFRDALPVVRSDRPLLDAAENGGAL
jgi:cytochrome c oxidase subunit 1